MALLGDAYLVPPSLLAAVKFGIFAPHEGSSIYKPFYESEKIIMPKPKAKAKKNQPAAPVQSIADTLVPIPVNNDSIAAQVTSDTKPAAPSAVIKSCKAHIRELLADGNTELSIEDICKLTGMTQVNVRTQLSDLRSPKYAGKKGVFLTTSVKRNDKTFYHHVK